MADSLHLLVAFPDKEPVSFHIAGEKVTLGRSPSNNIQILVREVSTSHCEFIQTDSGYTINDVGSTNGTRVNDQSVKNGAVALRDRDFILLGETIPAYFVKAAGDLVADVRGIIASIDKERAAALAQAAASKKIALPVKPPVSAPAPAAQVPPTEGGGSSTIKLINPPGPVTTKLAEEGPTIRKLTPPPAKVEQETPATEIPTLAPAAKVPTLTPPAAKVPTLTPPAAKVPTLTPPAAKVPTLTPPAAKVPTLTPPATKVPTLTPPAAKVPTLTPPAAKVPTLTPPAAKVPTLTPPAAKVPTLTPPAAKVPTLTPPAAKVPTLTPPAAKVPGLTPPVKLATPGEPPKKLGLPKLNLPKKEDES